MKHLLRFGAAGFALCALLVLSGCPDPGSSCIEIVHLSFNNSVVDSAASPHPVTTIGKSKYVPNRFNQLNRALWLDGNASLSIPDRADLHFTGTSSFTLSAWILTRYAGDAGIICKGPANGPVPGYRLDLVRGHPHASITATGANVEITGPNSIADNVWHRVTLTVSPARVTLYVDSLPVGSHAGAQLVPDSLNNGPLLIGTTPNGAHNFNGYLDEIIVRGCAEAVGQLKNGMVMTLPDLPPGVREQGPVNGILASSWPSGSNTGFCCGTGGVVLRCTSPASDWTSCTSPSLSADLFAISFINDHDGVVIGNPRSVFITHDQGATWNAAPFNYPPAWRNVQISDVRYLNGLVVIAGHHEYLSGGYGFVASGAVTTTSSGVPSVAWNGPIENFGQGEIVSLGSGYDGQNQFLWAVGLNGQIWKYNVTATTIGVGSSNTPFPSGGPTFHSCDFTSTSNPILGFAGTRTGEIYQYTGGQWLATPDPMQQPITDSWVIGLSASSTNSWAVADGSQGGVVLQKVGGTWSIPAGFPSSLWTGLTAANGVVTRWPYPLVPTQTTSQSQSNPQTYTLTLY